MVIYTSYFISLGKKMSGAIKKTVGSIAGGMLLNSVLADYFRSRTIERCQLPIATKETQNFCKTTLDQMGPSLKNEKVLVVKTPDQASAACVYSLWAHKTLIAIPEIPDPLDKAVLTHEIAHRIRYHRTWQDILEGGLAGGVFSVAYKLSMPKSIFFIIGLIPMGILLNRTFSRQIELDADETAVHYFPERAAPLADYLERNKAPKTTTLKVKLLESLWATHPALDKRIAHLNLNKHTVAAIYQAVKQSTETHTDILLDPYQRKLIENFNQTIGVRIDSKTLETLRIFYVNLQKEVSPLGDIYRSMSFEQYLQRLMHCRFKTAFMDARVLIPRNFGDKWSKAVGDGRDVIKNRQMLCLIGTPDDQDKICEEYLSRAEIIMSALMPLSGITLAIGTGSRSLESDPVQELNRVAPAPYFISQAFGVECRDGLSGHFDLMMTARPAHPNQAWADAIAAVTASKALMSVAHNLYAEKLAFEYNPETLASNPDFIAVRNHSGDLWYVSRSAYKGRLKQQFIQLLSHADQVMSEHRLGQSFNLKGLGLGAFGFYHASLVLEKLAREALIEALADHPLNYIKQLNLINWPSLMGPICDLKYLSERPKLTYLCQIGGVVLKEGLCDPLDKRTEGLDYPIGGTHSCADSASAFGNEIHIGETRASSDDPAVSESILNSLVFSDYFLSPTKEVRIFKVDIKEPVNTP